MTRLGPVASRLLRHSLKHKRSLIAPANQTSLKERTLVVPSTKVNAVPSLKTYIELAKPKLTCLVVLSTMATYALAPFPAQSLSTLLFLTAGTTLCSASANAYNQWLEPPFDAQMVRTRNRPLVRGALHPNQAFSFASVCGAAGTTALLFGVNPVCSALGLANIVLYAGIYTPLKRVSITNTWVGAVVGAIPPVMGWAASTPYPILSLENLGGLYLGLLLYAWQFPHFNSLAWYIRAEYARAGYVMTSVQNPGMNARVSLRYALACWPISYGFVQSGIVNEWFLLDSSILNAYLTYRAWEFWQQKGSDKQKDKSARSLFFASLIYLPGILLVAMGHKVWDDIHFGHRYARETIEMLEAELERMVQEDIDKHSCTELLGSQNETLDRIHA